MRSLLALAACALLLACSTTPNEPPPVDDAGVPAPDAGRPPTPRPDAGLVPVRTIEIDGQNDFREEDRLPTGDGKQLYATWDETHLFVGFANEDLSPDNKALYLALDVDGEPLGSRITPRGEWFEGSTVFLPIAADVLIFAKSYQGKAEVYRRVWQDAGWAARAEEPKVTCRFTAGFGECAIDRSLLNGARTLNFAAWAKDLASAAAPGWGWTFGTSDAELPGGAGERVLRHFHAFDLTKPRAESVPRVRRTGREGARIYQLLVRLFGNRNATRKVNGTLAENGVGRFADLDDKALAALKELSVSHVWLTGVLQQATATDYAAAGQGADDPDLLKGLAGSPYAIRDYFDVSPDYATDPAKRLEEFDALLARLHGRGLKALIDLVPNHVARSYASDVKPEHDFGTRGRGGQGDDTSKFFDPGNNFFHLQQPLTLPFAQSSTCQLGTPPLREPCDGRFAPENGRARVTGNNVTSERPSVGDWYETVKLNFGFDFTNGQRSHPRDDATDAPVPDTWTKLDAVIAYWQARGVDGFRVDMAHMVPHQFWQWAIARARQRDADVLFIAEAYETDPASTVGNVLQHLLHAGFDAVYDDDTYDVLKEIYDGSRWANDLDALASVQARAHESLRYAENHDEVRLASSGNWRGAGMQVGRAVSGLLFGLSRGPVMLYNGQEVGEPAAGREGFGGDDGRTSIFDYWSMPELQKWVNGGAFDGGQLSQAQKDLRAFYARLVALRGEPAFQEGGFVPLNAANAQNASFGRLSGETASGHWLYAYARHTDAQRFVVVVNLHPTETLRGVRVVLGAPALKAMGIPFEGADAGVRWSLTDRLGPVGAASATAGELANGGVTLADLPPLTSAYFELKKQ